MDCQPIAFVEKSTSVVDCWVQDKCSMFSLHEVATSGSMENMERPVREQFTSAGSRTMDPSNWQLNQGVLHEFSVTSSSLPASIIYYTNLKAGPVS